MNKHLHQINLAEQLAADGDAVGDWLSRWFDAQPDTAPRLRDAMAYSVLNGGKRMRASLVLSAARLARSRSEHSSASATGDPLAVAGAVEMLHAYSLIHDDLPAMDDADTRRKQPSSHIAFDEATAILAGDALQSAAFEVLCDERCHPDAQIRCQLVSCLAKASGLAGMAGGQMLDLQAESDSFSLDQTSEMQALKTGALISASAVMGGICGGDAGSGSDGDMIARLAAFAKDLGLAFQIADDLLDYQGTTKHLGKPAGRDAQTGKASYVAFFGVDGARKKAEKLVSDACAHLAIYEDDAAPLLMLAQFSISRAH